MTKTKVKQAPTTEVQAGRCNPAEHNFVKATEVITKNPKGDMVVIVGFTCSKCSFGFTSATNVDQTARTL